MYNVKKVVGLFTDYFHKDPESNMYKLIQLFTDELNLLKEVNNHIIEWRDIDKAEGQALDLIGQNVLQPRGQATDVIYRILLKAKIARNHSDGTINTIIKITALTLSMDVKNVRIKELWSDPKFRKPAAIKFETNFYKDIYKVGLDTYTLTEILDSIVAGGVKVHVENNVYGEGIFKSAMLCGESVTLYPYTPSEIVVQTNSKSTAVLYNGDDTVIYPKQ